MRYKRSMALFPHILTSRSKESRCTFAKLPRCARTHTTRTTITLLLTYHLRSIVPHLSQRMNETKMAFGFDSGSISTVTIPKHGVTRTQRKNSVRIGLGNFACKHNLLTSGYEKLSSRMKQFVDGTSADRIGISKLYIQCNN